MPKDPRAFLQLAEEHRRMGRLKEAIAVCLEGLGQHPNLHAASITLGRSYLEAGNFQDARTTLEAVCARLPEHHLAARLLAETQCRMGDLAAAAATCKAILVHYPRDREFETMLAEIAAEQERPAPGAEQATAPRTGPPVAQAPADAAASQAAAGVDPDLEYAPEDVAPSVTPARASVVARPDAGPRTGAQDALQTNTLAELYVKQGLVERAMEVYRAMLRVDASNERARRRLAELEAGAASGAVSPAGPASTTSAPPTCSAAPAAGAGPDAGSASEPAESAGAASVPDRGGRRATVVRLERWLERVTTGAAAGRGSTGR